MKNVGDIVTCKKHLTFFYPRFHEVAVGTKGQVENTHKDVRVMRVENAPLISAPNLVRFSGAPGAVWVADDEIG